MVTQITNNYLFTDLVTKGEAPNVTLNGSTSIVVFADSASCPDCRYVRPYYFEISEEYPQYDFYTIMVDGAGNNEIIQHFQGTFTPLFVKVTSTGQVMIEDVKEKAAIISGLNL